MRKHHRWHLELDAHLAAQSLGQVVELDLAAELERDPPLDEPGAEAAPARRLDRRPALLRPDQVEVELLLPDRMLERPDDRDAAGLVRQRAIFDRVRRKLVEGETERDRGARSEMHVVQPGEADARRLRALRIRLDLDLEQSPQRGAGPSTLGQEVMRPRQREQPLLEGGGEVGEIARRAQGLVGERLDRRERVLDPMIELVDQELALLL